MTSDPSSAGRYNDRPCTDERYGVHAQAHPAIAKFVEDVHAILDTTDADEVPERVAERLKQVLATENLLAEEHRAPDPSRYRKHILYACPEGRFTLLALIWLPGQSTTIHGHTSWGAVGVYEGSPNVACYECSQTEDGRHEVTETKDICCTPGDLAIVRAGLGDVHRIYNDSDETMITLHNYGLDLVEDPDAINIELALQD